MSHVKPSDLKQGHDRPKLRAVEVEAAEVKPLVPKPEGSWLKVTKGAWDTFWSSDLAAVIEAPDRPVLYRLFALRDMQERAFRRYKREPYVMGSMGQPVTNPEFASAMKLETAITALEDRLGLSPKARVNLSIAIGQTRLTAAELNERARRDAQEVTGGDSDGETLDAEGWEQA